MLSQLQYLPKQKNMIMHLQIVYLSKWHGKRSSVKAVEFVKPIALMVHFILRTMAFRFPTAYIA